jgi:hypothetical protein
MPYNLDPALKHSLCCLAAWFLATGQFVKYNQTSARFNLGLPYQSEEPQQPELPL